MNSFEQVEMIKRDIMSYYLANVSLLTELKPCNLFIMHYPFQIIVIKAKKAKKQKAQKANDQSVMTQRNKEVDKNIMN